jgi:hypothetical protein
VILRGITSDFPELEDQEKMKGRLYAAADVRKRGTYWMGGYDKKMVRNSADEVWPNQP